MKTPARSSRLSRTIFIFVSNVRPSPPLVPMQTCLSHTHASERNGRKTLTTVQGLPKKFDQKKILKVIKKKFACNGTIVTDAEMGEVVQLQGDQRKDVQDFLTDKKEGLGLDAKTIKVSCRFGKLSVLEQADSDTGPRFLISLLWLPCLRLSLYCLAPSAAWGPGAVAYEGFGVCLYIVEEERLGVRGWFVIIVQLWKAERPFIVPTWLVHHCY